MSNRHFTCAAFLLAAPFAPAQSWSEITEVFPGTGLADPDVESVALSGDTLVVGTPNGFGIPDGEVFVYERNSGGPDAWGQVRKLLSPVAQTYQSFGYSVAIDGDTLVVGATSTFNTNGLRGRAFVYERDDGDPTQWNLSRQILPTTDNFGWSVSLSGDTLVVGGNSGAVVHERDQGGTDNWGVVTALDPSLGLGGGFGSSSGISGDTIVVGAWYAGSGRAFVFERDQGGPNAWGQVAVLVSANPAFSGRFAWSVAALDDTVVCGATYEYLSGTQCGRAYFYGRDTGGPGAWGLLTELAPPAPDHLDEFGSGAAAHGGRIAVGAKGKDIGYSTGNMAGVAFDPGAAIVYGTDAHQAAPSDFVTIDPQSGVGALVGGVGYNDVMGLAYDPTADILYGTERDTGLLLTLDPSTGQATAVGTHGFGNVAGLAFDPGTGTLYGTDNTTNRLVTLNTSTGAGTAIGKLGFSTVRSLAFDPTSNRLYGADSSTEVLIEIDTATGLAYAIGPIGFNLRGMAFDPSQGLLLGLDYDELISIDPSTGAGTSVGPLHRGPVGAAYVYERAGSTWSGPTEVIAGSGSPFEGFGDSVAIDGDTLAAGVPEGGGSGGSTHVFGHVASTATYCTAGISASGCQALLSASGTPSASATSGFDLNASGVEGGKDGLFFFGVNGRQANPWGSGTSFQCVVPPVVRTGLLAGVGTAGSCDGTFAHDLNALWCPGCPNSAKNPSSGATVQAQLWYRDPFNTSNQTTSLSDAIEFGVQP